MRDALSLASHAWWMPSTLLAVTPALALIWGVDHRLRRANRLADAGWRDEALRVYAAVQRDIAADLRRARGRRGAPLRRPSLTQSSVTALAALRRRLVALVLPAP